jgi:hypothetical protein
VAKFRQKAKIKKIENKVIFKGLSIAKSEGEKKVKNCKISSFVFQCVARNIRG